MTFERLAEELEAPPKPLSAVVLQLLEPFAEQLLTTLNRPLLIAFELTSSQAVLNGLARRHISERIDFAKVAPFLCGQILQQLTVQAAVTTAVFALPQARAKVAHKDLLPLVFEHLVGLAGKRNWVVDEGRGLCGTAQSSQKHQGAQMAEHWTHEQQEGDSSSVSRRPKGFRDVWGKPPNTWRS